MTTATSAAAARIITDGRSIREQLRATEATMDEALLGSAELMKRLIAARANPDVAPAAGQKVLIRLMAAQQAMVDGASGLFRVHDELTKVGIEYGMPDQEGSTPASALSDSDVARPRKLSATA